MNQYIYKESQLLINNPILRVVMVIVFLATFAEFLLFSKLFSSGADLIVNSLVIIGIIIFFGFAKLNFTITSKGLLIRFIPFHLKGRFIKFSEIEKATAKDYRPIVEYGGWGIRYNFKKGMAYNVYGKKGVLIELKNGKSIMLGSQKYQELSSILNNNLK